jgi:hypothetical protein
VLGGDLEPSGQFFPNEIETCWKESVDSNAVKKMLEEDLETLGPT